MPELYENPAFLQANTYGGRDLGAVYGKEQTNVRLWAPTAEQVVLNLYSDGDPAAQPNPVRQVLMEKSEGGTWSAPLLGDWDGWYYTYTVTLEGEDRECCDPYARSAGVNSHRGMILDLNATNPAGWEQDRDPHAGMPFTDAVIYELHLRDLSADRSAGISHVGKFLGLTETGTKNSCGQSTGLDHIKKLGVTHVHLLPIYDFGSVDERSPENSYNWGYDPVLYNVPEGSYSTDPYHGQVRVKELKQTVQALHQNGLSVIMDVVYNHVYETEGFCFNRIVPGYFSRPDSNGSGCGNDTASERPMVRKYIVESVKYWAEEYHIDGFRFDLVGLIDTQTVGEIMEAVHETCPNVVFYGEGWTMETHPVRDCLMTTQENAQLTPGFAFFSDTLRDALRGSVFYGGPGFVSGAAGEEDTLRQCFRGMPQWCPSPAQSINYVSCHDNHTLFDRIALGAPKAKKMQLRRMNRLAAAICMTCQGIPFFQAGEEMLRSKPLPDGGFEHNSYCSPDSLNSLKWDDLGKAEYQNTLRYYQGLIAFRKAHPVLRLQSPEQVAQCIRDVEALPEQVVGFHLLGQTAEDGQLYVIFNASEEAVEVSLPEGTWQVCINAEKAGTKVLETVSAAALAAPVSALVLVKDK